MDHYEAGTAERSAPISREAVYIIIHVDLKLMLCVNKSPSEKECWSGLNYKNWSRNSISKTAPKHFDGRKEQGHCVFFCHLTSRENFDEWLFVLSGECDSVSHPDTCGQH